MDFLHNRKQVMVEESEALRGRDVPVPIAPTHFVLSKPATSFTLPQNEEAIFGMGCFWGAERLFWQVPGVVFTAAGYAGGYTENPNYHEVCSGMTGHAEVVRVVFDPAKVTYLDLLRVFFEGHDPTQVMRQGNDVGTQYRSVIYTFTDEQTKAAHEVASSFGERLHDEGFGDIATEIVPITGLVTPEPFYYAEINHQQYLAKNPNGYCGLGGTGVSCQVGILSE
jgi:peptide-methionine (S)-S-oxide reductase